MDPHAHRKDEHVFIAEKQFSEVSQNGLDQVRLLPATLPELALDDISLETTLVGKKIAFPFFINAITGGSPRTDMLNEQLAYVATKTGLAFETGSQSVGLKFKDSAKGFKKLRENYPLDLLIGNLGAGNSLENCQKALTMLQADALAIHLNVAQELVMPEGDRSFYWLSELKKIKDGLTSPLLIKEVGGGISPNALVKLKELGIRYVDLSGSGGTDFIAIENERRTNKEFDFLTGFGLNTAEVLVAASSFKNDFSFTASGGIRNALDIAKCIALGADNVGISGYFLHILLREGVDSLIDKIEDMKKQLKKIILLVGCKNIKELQEAPVILSSELLSFKQQIKKQF